MKELTADIDLDHEVAAVASFISLKWTAISNVQQFVADIRQVAERQGKSLFENHALWACAKDLLDARTKLLARKSGFNPRVGLEYYDAVCILLDSVKSSAKEISDAGRAMLGAWDIGTQSKKLHAVLDERYPDLAEASPRGWDVFESALENVPRLPKAHDVQADRDAFHGACVQGVRSAEFPVRAGLPEVFRYAKCQGRKPSQQLVAAVLAHFMGITEFLNTDRLVKDLPRALPELHEPAMLFERTTSTDNPFLKVAFETAAPCRPREQLEESIAAIETFDALSPEEKAKNAAERNKRVAEFITGLNTSAEEDQTQWDAERERYSVLLSKALEG
jgi:hypothetical protein